MLNLPVWPNVCPAEMPWRGDYERLMFGVTLLSLRLLSLHAAQLARNGKIGG